ncbi:MAG: sugar kinase [bacterium]|nr:MAG: sugar kinase [bacterium]
MKKFDVIVVGELNIDLVLWDVPFPEYEKEKLAKDMRFTMGSSSAITSHNLSAIGSKVTFIGKAGKDAFGDYMIQNLEKVGVDTSGIIIDTSLKTGATIVLANPPRKALLTYMGAMTHLFIDDIDWELVRQTRHLHMGCYYLQTGMIPDVPGLFKTAKKYGLTTSLDTNWDPSETWHEDIYQVLKYTDIFLPNDDEAVRIAHESSLAKAISKLRKMVKILVIKKGEVGVSVYSDSEELDLPGYRTEVVETTGAGDSFNAGFIHRFLKGDSLMECARYGNACGALAVSAIGGTGAFQDRKRLKNKIDTILQEQ